MTDAPSPQARLDWRQHAYRADLADSRLRARVSAAAFVDGRAATVGNTALALLRRPSPDAPMDSQLLPGEAVRVFDEHEGWAWVQCAHDGYVGYVASCGLESGIGTASHWVAVRETVVLSDADQVCRPLHSLSLGAQVQVSEVGERFHRLASGGFVFARHLRSVSTIADDWIAVAEALIGLPYLWGGRGAGGVDCSGLVQIALAACGIACPRDSDQQAAGLGMPVPLDPAAWKRGDAIYVPGHVVLNKGDGQVVHATGYAWSVMVEPLDRCLARLADQGRPVTSVRRPVRQT